MIGEIRVLECVASSEVILSVTHSVNSGVGVGAGGGGGGGQNDVQNYLID